MGHGDAGRGALAESFAPDGLQFHGFPGLPVELAGGFVVAHGPGAGDFLFNHLRILRVAQFCRSRQHLSHQILGFLMECGVFQNLLGVTPARASRDAESVEWNVPDQFIPAGGTDGRGHGATHPGDREDFCKGAGTGSVAARKIGKFNICAGHVPGHARFWSGDTDMADPAQHPFSADDRGQQLLVSQSILKGANHCLGADQRGDEMFQVGVGRGLDADEHEIDRSNLLRLAAGADRVQQEVPVRAAHLNAVFLQMGEISARQKGNRHPGFGQLGAVVHAEGPCAHHGGSGMLGKRVVRAHGKTVNRIPSG